MPSGSANTRNRDSRCSCSILEDASCCYLDFSCSWSWGGRKPAANALQLGCSKPRTPVSLCAESAAICTLWPWISFQLSNDSDSHLRMTSVDHGQTICPTRPEPSPPGPGCASQTQSSKNERKSGSTSGSVVAQVNCNSQKLTQALPQSLIVHLSDCCTCSGSTTLSK